MQSLTAEILDVARDSGADAVGTADVAPFLEARVTLQKHKKAGLSGPLHFTFDHPVEATDVTESFPWARSLVVMGRDYLGDARSPETTGAIVGRFATRDHYGPLRSIADAVSAALHQRGYRAEALIDDNRLADRLPAIRSGLGWQGRSTMVLSPGHGPWLLLGTVVTDALLTPTEASSRSCGTCTACIPACPTGAITEGGLDARRCLSTWLQTGGSMPLWIRPLVGRRIYGCDDCLVACPPGFPRLREADPAPEKLDFAELLSAKDEHLLSRFSHWYIPGREARFLRRNILVAAGNSGEMDAWEQIRLHLGHDSAVVRGHAAWALARSGATSALADLYARLDEETLPGVIEELEIALLMKQNSRVYQGLLAKDEAGRLGGSINPRRDHRDDCAATSSSWRGSGTPVTR